MAAEDIEKEIHAHCEAANSQKELNITIDQHSRHKSPAERRVVLKQDLTIFPLVSVMFFFAYVDRGQIGNARILGLQTDLNLSNGQFFNALMMFYVGYMAFELPVLLALRVVKPAYLYGGGTIIFGVLATCIAYSGSYAGLMVIRVLIGFVEATAQTVYIFLSLWYKRDEIATRTCLFLLAAPTAGAVTGLIAYGVGKNMNGTNGLQSWQWLFIVEGVPTIGWGIVLLIFTPSMPDTVAVKGSVFFRTEEEKEIIRQRTIAGQNEIEKNAKIRPFQILIAIKDIKTWLMALVVGASLINVAALSTLLPTFIHNFGFSPLDTQLYSMVPYAFAIVATVLASVVSDRYQQKAIPLIMCLITCLVGLILLLATTNRVALIAGSCFVAAGGYPSSVLSASWLVTTNAGYTKRCTAWAIAQLFGQSWSIVASQVYTNPPRYFKGHGTLLGLITLGIAAALANYRLMLQHNVAKDRIAEEFRQRGEVNPDSAKGLEELCDKHPDYRYAL